MSDEHTHYIRWDARGGRLVRALCGVALSRRAHASEPTCPVCSDILKVDADQLEVLKAAPFDPDLVVKHEPFDPCVAYTPRGETK